MSELTLTQHRAIAYWSNKLRQTGGSNFYNIAQEAKQFRQLAADRHHITLPAALCEKVITAARDKDINIYKLLMTALYILLGKYTQRSGLLITSSGINLDELLPAGDPVLTFFSVAVEEELSAKELLGRIHKELENNISYQQYDGAALTAALQNRPEEEDAAFATGLYYEPVNIYHPGLDSMKLLFRVSRSGDVLDLQMDYQPAYYKPEAIALIACHLERTLELICDDLSLKLGSINFITEHDSERVFCRFNQTEAVFPQLPVIEQFERQAADTPDALAVKSGDVKLSYCELNEKANQLAYYLLRERRLRPQDKVALMVNRSEKIIIGIIGILKAGGVYIPVDLSAPQERVQFFLEDSECKVVLTDDVMAGIPQLPVTNPVIDRDPHELAYMIYTSGTTGKPKGAMIHHLGLANHVNWFRRQFGITPADSTMLINSYSFDGCYSYIWATLTSGAALHVPNDHFFDPDKTLQYIKQEEITFLKMVPSTFGVLVNSRVFDTDPEACRSVRIIKQGGETINVKHLRKYLEKYPHIILGNHYGATESTIGSVAHWINKDTIDDFARQPVLGAPFDNQYVYILDKDQQLQPIGVPGEICIGGAGVGKGYFKRETLTANKFIADPFRPGERLYRTGDHGRWLPDGTLEFFGRVDNQVKIRGYRVELDEIATVIKAHPDVQDAVVLVYNKDGQDQLAAYLMQATAAPDLGALQEHCRAQLPDYMIPLYFVPVSRIPLTPNGKLDKRALPDPEKAKLTVKGNAVAPRNEMEARLLELWCALLDVQDIGVTDNFFEIGGHSLKATQLVALIHKQLHVQLPLREIFFHPTIESLAPLLQTADHSGFTDILRVGEQEDYALSHAQQRMWVIAKMQDEQMVYNIPHAVALEGTVDLYAFEKALAALLERHEILRTVFITKQGMPRQQVLPAKTAGVDFAYTDLRTAQDKNLLLENIAGSEASTVFDMEQGPLVKARLLQLEDNAYVFLFTLHHIISDGWSTQVIFSDLLRLYKAFSEYQQDPLPPLKIQYKDFAAWQNHLLQSSAIQPHRDYWHKKLGGALPVLELPADYPRPRVMTFAGDYKHLLLDQETHSQLSRYAAANQVSLFIVLMAAVKTLLYRYTGQQDLIVGTPIAGREHYHLADQVGFYVNTLAIRSQVQGNQSFHQLLQDQVKENMLEAYQHQLYPFDQLIDDLGVERDTSRTPLFSVMTVMQNNTSTREALFEMNGLKALPYNNENPVSKFDLTIDFEERNDGLVIGIEYYTDLFAAPRITRMLDHLSNILKAVAQHPEQLIDELQYMTAAEQQEISGYAGTVDPVPAALTVHGLFEAQAQQTPYAPALSDKQKSYTYAELDEKANRWATAICEAYTLTGPANIATVMSRGADFVVSMLATLKLGCAYLPIESQTPQERILQLLESTGTRLVITDNETLATDLASNVQVLHINDLDTATTSTYPHIRISAHSLAYIMFTSGSTGRPKAVMIPHRGIIRLVKEMNYVELTADDNILQTGALSFDAATFEIWGALLNGGQVHVLDLADLLDVATLEQAIREKGITKMFITTSWFNQLADHQPRLFETVKHILVGGEKISVPHIHRVQEHCPDLRVANIYGPTENTTFSLFTDITAGADLIPLGKPISNTSIYILDAHMRLVPKGIHGEILLGGEGLALGYMNDEERTARQFVPHPFIAGERLYRTGDLGMWLEDGNVEFMGRLDDQVKIRGYRVEPGEIMHSMQSHPAVKEAVVIVHRKENGENILAAYYTTHEPIGREALREYLSRLLPAHMVPAALMELPVMPLNENGKTDRKALPAPEIVTTGHEAPRNQTEVQLAAIWQQLLAIDKVSIHDNFFELGGHSLLATRLIAAIRHEMGIALTVRELFLHQTIATLAAHIAVNSAVAELPSIMPYPDKDRTPLSFSQERLWFIDQLEGSVAYHIPVVLRIEGAFDRPALQQALQAIVHRHEVLRTVFRTEDGKAWQEILPAAGWRLTEDMQDEAVPDEHIRRLADQPFDLSKDYMLRAHLSSLSEDTCILTLVMHHIAADGWSMSILVKELMALFDAAAAGTLVALPALPVQYADYAVWQRRYLEGPVLEKQLGYWQEKLADVTPLLLPADYPRAAVQSAKGQAFQFEVNRELYDALASLSQKESVTLFMTLLAAFKALLYRYTAQTDICVGTPIAGRTQRETEELIGFFVNTLALRSDLSNDPSFKTLLQQVKQTTLDAYANQHAPFEKVVDRLGVERNLGHSPLFQVMFVLQNTPDIPELEIGATTISLEPFSSESAKFDITFDLSTGPNGLDITIQYCTDLFAAATIARMASHYCRLLEAIVREPAQPISALPMLTEKETHLLLELSKGTELHGTQQTVIDWFYEQAADTPDAPALVFEQHTLSYRELNERSDRLAHYLRQRGAEADIIVPLLLERSPEMLISILAVMKAGAAYVPVDPAYPAERIAYILKDIGADLVVCSTATRHLTDSLPEAYIVCLDHDTTAIFLAAMPATRPELIIQPGHLAYVIYTSGSTGMPKGVMLKHSNLSASTMARINYYGPVKHTLLIPSFSFDPSVAVIWNTLLSGGSLILTREEGIRDAEIVRNILKHYPVDILFCVPSYYRFLLEEGLLQHTAINRVIVGGEALDKALVQQHYATVKGAVLYNEYGPTETTVWATVDKTLPDTDTIAIGSPVPGVQVYLLDDFNNLVPAGVTGELCIGGGQVAAGYLHQPELTAEKFVPDPFSSGVLYRTGDLARRLPDGRLEFIGRRDDQVKIRGYRVEPGEIENAIRKCAGVRQCVVLARADRNGHKRLIAYVVPEGVFDREAVKASLAAALPDYMIPGGWMTLDALPLTANGKVNKELLPELTETANTADVHVPPSNEIEATLAGIWSALLQKEHISMQDNFFELGGDSIITIQVVSRMRRAGYILHPRDLFQHQTIAALAACVRTELETAAEQGVLAGEAGLLPIQQWFFEQDFAAGNHFNHAVLLHMDRQVTAAHLQTAVAAIGRHHDALRFSYHREGNRWVQTYSDRELQLRTIDLRSSSITSLAYVIAAVCYEQQQSLCFTSGDLCRFVWIRTPDTDTGNRLFIVINHLAIDGVSWRILLEDLKHAIDQLFKGEMIQLGTKTSAYRQWQQVLARYAVTKAPQQLEYWKTIAEAWQPLPADHAPAGPVLRKDLRTHMLRLGKTSTKLLLGKVHQVFNTDMNDWLLAVLAQTICEWSGGEKILIGLEGHGREPISPDIDLTHTVGWFTNMYPVLLEPGQHADETALLRSVKEQLRNIPDKGIGYGALRYLHPSPEINHMLAIPSYDIVFNYLGQQDNTFTGNNWFCDAEESGGPAVSGENAFTGKLEITASVVNGELIMAWTYNLHHYKATTIRQLAAGYKKLLDQLITIVKDKQYGLPTPADFGLNGLVHFRQLDRFLGALCNGQPVKEQVAGLYPLSPLQEGMLFHGLYEPDSNAYVAQISCEINGELDVPLFKTCWQHLVAAHSILRSSFHYEELSIPVQLVHHHATLPFAETDLRHYTAAEQEAQVSAFLKEDLEHGISFAVAPLMRITLLRLSDHQYKMVWTSHHLLMDGWSMAVVIKELLEGYEALVNDQALPVIKEDRYEDYIRYILRQDKDAAERFWRTSLSGLENATLLPFTQERTERNKGQGAYGKLKLEMDAAFSARLQEYAQRSHITVNTVLQGVWAYLLSRYTGSADVVFGVTVAGRPVDLEDAEQRVGLYINTLPLRVTLQEERTVSDWLSALQTAHTLGRDHQYTPLSRIQGLHGVQGDLFDSILVYENYPVEDAASAEGRLKIDNLRSHDTTNYLLTLTMSMGERLSVTFEYNASLLPDAYVEQIHGHFKQVLEQMVSHPGRILAGLELLTNEEVNLLLHTFNDTRGTDLGNRLPINVFFEQQAAMHADQPAVIHQQEVWTYATLNRQANRIAHLLQSLDLKPGDLTGVHLERGPWLVAAILGIIKAGGVYVPLDTQNPSLRTKELIAGSQIKILITHSSLPVEAPDPVKVLIDWQQLEQFADSNPVNINSMDSWAYMLYTSGSTGKPKGAITRHDGALNHILAEFCELELPDGFRFLQSASIASDISVWQILAPVLKGGAVVIIDKEDLLDYERLLTILREQQVSIAEFVPSYLSGLIEYLEAAPHIPALPSLKCMMAVGEQLYAAVANDWLRLYPSCKMLNGYGPCEASDDITQYLITSPLPVSIERVPIGKPISNMNIFILDKHERLLPVGVTGELCVSGVGVGAGYWNEPGKTAEKFRPNPFAGTLGDTLYKTGDLARWLPDGNLEFLGRADNQVKIRGYRIELGEVESSLQQCECVQEAVVEVRTYQGDKRLIAYIIPKGEYGEIKKELRAFVNANLPSYMHPAEYVLMESFPLNLSDKVDRNALPEADVTVREEATYVAPRNELEAMLVKMWSTLLPLRQISIYDNFFEIGGNSLLAIRLAGKIKQAFGFADFPIVHLFRQPSIAQLAPFIQQEENGLAAVQLRHLLLLQKGSNPAPIFIIPGSLGVSDGYYELAAALGANRPVYGIQMQGVFEGEMPYQTLQEIAAANIAWIRQIQPRGPYCLIGHSFGGWVLYEMLLQLEAQEETAEMAVILDERADAPPLDKRRKAEHLLSFRQQFRELEENDPACFERLLQVLQANMEIAFAPEMETTARIILVKAATRPRTKSTPDMGWGRYAGNLVVLTTPGDHFSMITGKHAVTLAATLRDLGFYSVNKIN